MYRIDMGALHYRGTNTIQYIMENTFVIFKKYQCLLAHVRGVFRRIGILRIDKGYRRSAMDLARRFITMMDAIVNYSYSDRVHFSLFNDVYIILIS